MHIELKYLHGLVTFISKFLIHKLVTTMLTVPFELNEIFECILHKGDYFIIVPTSKYDE